MARNIFKFLNFKRKSKPEPSVQTVFEKNKDTVSQKIRDEFETALKKGKKILLVYQMGKVGSSSYAAALEKCNALKVFHVHRLNTQQNEEKITRFLANGRLNLAFMEQRWKTLKMCLEAKQPEVFIVTAMRDPVARNISAFFQNLNLDKQQTIDELINEFFSNYPHRLPLEWFDQNFKKGINIDIFQKPFNKEKGWDSFKERNYTCLLLTAEISDKEKLDAINAVFGIQIPELLRTNVGADKPYAKRYKEFKSKLNLTEDYVERLLNSKVARHFYTQEKCDSFRRYWLDPSPGNRRNP